MRLTILKNLKTMNADRIRLFKKKAMIALLYPLKMLPVVKNRVLFDNSLSHTYSDNLKYTIEKLLDTNADKLDIYFSVLDMNKYEYLRECGINLVKYGSLEYYITAMRSSVYVTNSGGYSFLPLKRNQLVINTWHGGGCYKKMGLDKVNVPARHAKELKYSAQKTGYFLCTCKMFSRVIKHALLIDDSKHLLIGMPRNDILVNYSGEKAQEKRNNIRARLGIKEGQMLVLFSPTYRKPKGEPFGKSLPIDYKIDGNRLCDALQRRFGGEWIFSFRFHPSIRYYIQCDTDMFPTNAINLSDYDDMQELLLAADVMINDFSSSIWDFMLTQKPCFIYACDMQDYITNTQLYSPINEWPFPKAENNDQLEQIILSFDEDDYKKKCNEHYSRLGGCESGKATDIVAELILKHCI